MAATKKSTASKKKVAAKKAAAKKKTATASKKTATKRAVKKTAAKKTASSRKAPAAKQPTRSGNNLLTVGGFEPYQPKKGEEYMSEAQLEHFRRILLEWKRELMEEVDRTVDHMKNDAANYADPADRATQEEEFSLELRTRDRERKLIKKINETLVRIDNGDYGYCDQCGVEIGLRRLEARPTATLCIDCKTLQEIKEKQMA